MSVFKELAITLCCVCVVCSVVDMLMPSGSMAKPMKMLTGAVLLIALITPFTKEVSFDVSDYYYRSLSSDEISKRVNNDMARGAANAVAKEIDAILKSKNISARIKIIVDIDESGCIDIRRAEIYTQGDVVAQTQSLSREINEKLSIDVLFKE